MSNEQSLIKEADRGDKDKAMQPLAVGTNFDCRDWDSNTPLHYAARNDGESHLRVAELLLENKASVDAVGHNNCTPLHVAASGGNQAPAAQAAARSLIITLPPEIITLILYELSISSANGRCE